MWAALKLARQGSPFLYPHLWPQSCPVLGLLLPAPLSQHLCQVPSHPTHSPQPPRTPATHWYPTCQAGSRLPLGSWGQFPGGGDRAALSTHWWPYCVLTPLLTALWVLPPDQGAGPAVRWADPAPGLPDRHACARPPIRTSGPSIALLAELGGSEQVVRPVVGTRGWLPALRINGPPQAEGGAEAPGGSAPGEASPRPPTQASPDPTRARAREAPRAHVGAGRGRTVAAGQCGS